MASPKRDRHENERVAPEPRAWHNGTVRWASAVSEQATPARAVSELAAELQATLGPEPADLAVLFASPHHASSFARLPGLVRDAFPRAVVIGCSGGGVIGGGHEIEAKPAISLSVAHLPDVVVEPFWMATDEIPADSAAWQTRFGRDATRHFLLLPDPFSCDAEDVVADLDDAFPTGRKVGGLASGGTRPGSNGLFLGGSLKRSGLVGVALAGAVVIDTLVAQGCRPIGNPMIVTRADGHVIEELDHKRPLDMLKALYESLPPPEQELFRGALFVGLEMKQELEYHGGELLARNLVGVDPKKGGIAVGAEVAPWQVVQFMLRDATAAAGNLERLLDAHVATGAPRPAGALLFSCLGRGQGLFGKVDHDTDLMRARLGPVPLGGFFCNGEIGPIGGATYVHGYTSAFALVRAP